MKILKIRVPKGYKMLEPGFEISFLTKTRIDKDMPNSDLVYLDEEGLLPYPLETVVIGKNSSGKSTVISLVGLTIELLAYGRINPFFFRELESLSLEVWFFESGRIFLYKGDFAAAGIQGGQFPRIQDESLGQSVLKKHYRKDLANAAFQKVEGFSPNAGGDTSMLPSFTKQGQLSLCFFPSASPFLGAFPYVFTYLKEAMGQGAIDKLVHLFDDSVDYIRLVETGNLKDSAFEFKRKGYDPIRVDAGYLESHLSQGTIRGINIYGASMIAFRRGGHIVVDEIEQSFNKNLIGNLILMFNDPSINKAKASLIYSTHYAELLDETPRCDNINIVHREGCVISLKNMASDYEVRTELLKSAQFDENAFDNLLNYDLLMELKEEIRGR